MRRRAVLEQLRDQRAEPRGRELLRVLRQVGGQPPPQLRHELALTGDRVARGVCHEPIRPDEIEVFPLEPGLAGPCVGAFSAPDVGADGEVAAADLLGQLRAECLVARLAGPYPAAGSDPEVTVREHEMDEKYLIVRSEDQRADALAGRGWSGHGVSAGARVSAGASRALASHEVLGRRLPQKL